MTQEQAVNVIQEIITGHGHAIGLPKQFPKQLMPCPTCKGEIQSGNFNQPWHPPSVKCCAFYQVSFRKGHKHPKTPKADQQLDSKLSQRSLSGASRYPDVHVSVTFNDEEKLTKASINSTSASEIDPRIILQCVKGLLQLHELLVKAGVLPHEDIEEMLFPSSDKSSNEWGEFRPEIANPDAQEPQIPIAAIPVKESDMSKAKPKTDSKIDAIRKLLAQLKQNQNRRA